MKKAQSEVIRGFMTLIPMVLVIGIGFIVFSQVKSSMDAANVTQDSIFSVFGIQQSQPQPQINVTNDTYANNSAEYNITIMTQKYLEWKNKKQ